MLEPICREVSRGNPKTQGPLSDALENARPSLGRSLQVWALTRGALNQLASSQVLGTSGRLSGLLEGVPIP